MFSWSTVCGSGPAVMGILNVTPDSFSDGGRYAAVDEAVAHGIALVEAGAALVDVGGESTRPGALPVAVEEELRRVVPVVDRLVARGIAVSVDTRKADVAEVALAHGAVVVNDVTGGADPALVAAVARAGAGLLVMHMQGEPATMQAHPHYDEVVTEVGDLLAARIEAARAAGVHEVAADPGLGFGKTTAHNLALLAGLPRLVARLGVPVVVGASRKRFLGALLRDGRGIEAPVDEREEATLATTTWALDHGARVVRVHDARAAALVVRLFAAMAAA